MNRTYITQDTDFHTYVDIVDDLTTVRIYDLTTGVHAKGNALRFSGDAYDENIGIQVALNRAVARLAAKKTKYYIRQTRPQQY